MLDESNLECDPTTARADKACKLAKGITDMARAMLDKCGSARSHCSSATRCLSLSRLYAVFQCLAAIARRELGNEQQSQIALPADMGERATRSPNRKGAGVAARLGSSV